MSAALTHVAVGLLLGLALRVRLRYLPLAGFLALLPDVDHFSQYVLPIPGLETRVTFHNVLFCVALPVAAYALLHLRKAPEDWMTLGAAAPVLMSSHLFLDMLPVDVSNPRVPLFWPFSGQQYTASAIRGNAADPTAFSTMTLLLLILATLTILTAAFMAWSSRAPSLPRLGKAGAPLALVLGWLLVFPFLSGAAYLVPAPPHPEAIFSLEDPLLLTPQGRLTAVVYHLGGGDAWRAGLRVDVLQEGERVASVTSPVLMTKGDRWVVNVALPERLRAATDLRVELRATADNHTYAAATALLRKSHVDVPLVLDAFTHNARGEGTLRIGNDGAFPLPPGAVRLLVSAADGSAVANLTNEARVGAGGTWTVRVALPANPVQSFSIRVEAVDDGFVYLRESRMPELVLSGDGGTIPEILEVANPGTAGAPL